MFLCILKEGVTLYIDAGINMNESKFFGSQRWQEFPFSRWWHEAESQRRWDNKMWIIIQPQVSWMICQIKLQPNPVIDNMKGPEILVKPPCFNMQRTMSLWLSCSGRQLIMCLATKIESLASKFLKIIRLICMHFSLHECIISKSGSGAHDFFFSPDRIPRGNGQWWLGWVSQ